MIPEHGRVVEFNDVLIGAIFLYPTGTSLAMMEYLIFDRTYEGKDRDDIIDELILKILDVAEYIGVRNVFTWTDLLSLKARYTRLGFISGDGCEDGLTNLINKL